MLGYAKNLDIPLRIRGSSSYFTMYCNFLSSYLGYSTLIFKLMFDLFIIYYIP